MKIFIKCPKCGEELDLDGIGGEYKAYVDLSDYTVVELGDLIEYYCKECGRSLPKKYYETIEEMREQNF